MTSQKKPGLFDRAKKLGEQLFTKRNMAIAAPIVAGAAALSSKRVRDAVGDAAKTAGDAIVKATPAKKSAKAPAKSAASTPAKPAASKSAKSSTAGRGAAVKRNSTATAKPAAKPKAAAKPRAKPAARKAAAPKAGDTPSGA